MDKKEYVVLHEEFFSDLIKSYDDLIDYLEERIKSLKNVLEQIEHKQEED